MTEIADLHHRSVDFFDSNVHAVGPDNWNDPTPCSEWSVHDLVNHVVNENLWTPELLGGKTIEDVGARFDGDCLGSNPLESWHSSARAAVDSVSSLSDLEQPVNVSWGQIPAHEYVTQLTLDHAVHGWDLGTAVRGDTEIDPELVDFLLRYVEGISELLQASGAFGEPVTVDSHDPQVRLLAALGRTAASE